MKKVDAESLVAVHTHTHTHTHNTFTNKGQFIKHSKNTIFMSTNM